MAWVSQSAHSRSPRARGCCCKRRGELKNGADLYPARPRWRAAATSV